MLALGSEALVRIVWCQTSQSDTFRGNKDDSKRHRAMVGKNQDVPAFMFW